MSDDERRDDEIHEDENEDENGDTPADAGEPPAGTPRTWAGRSRAGEDESTGMTEEFDSVEQELSAELSGEERYSEEEADSADELEEPPDEFEFAEEEDEDDGYEDEGYDDDEEPQGAEEDEEEEAAPAAAGAVAGQETVEVDTLALADHEAAQEAAHAGLAARAAKRGPKPKPGPAASVPPPGPPPAPGAAGEPPKRRLWLRFLAAAAVIVASVAAATAVSLLVYVTDIAEGLGELRGSRDKLERFEGGDPQTILILGSDKRSGVPGDPGRSDTTMLLRVDPDNDKIALFSLPRDLKVQIPDVGTDKLNAAYSYGGPELTLETVKELLDIKVNVLVNVDFEGFYDAVNAIDCVYIDVDRHYYVPSGSGYDDIDIEAGYTKLCGYRALDYVRYRHNDNDIVRGARQQDFLREARQRIPPRTLVAKRDELFKIFTDYTEASIEGPIQVLQMLETFIGARNATVQEVHFEGSFVGDYVVATKEQLQTAVDQFLGVEDTPGSRSDTAEPERPPDKPKKEKKNEPAPEPAMVDVEGLAVQHAQALQKELEARDSKLPVYYPTRIAPNSVATISEESRAFTIPGPDDKDLFYGYKFVVPYAEEGYTSYYGVSGVDWEDPPILNNPSETRTIDGDDYLLFYDGDRLRLVGWKTGKGAYWVINTLTQTLTEDEMLAIATSTKKLDG